MTIEQSAWLPDDDAPIEPRKSTTSTDRMLQGPVYGTLLRLSAPNIGEAIARVSFIAFDALFVGWIGTDALAGVSLVFPIFLIMQMMSASGIGTGTSAAVARALGAGNQDQASRVASQGILLALIVAILFTGIFLSMGPTIYSWMGADGNALEEATQYSAVVFSGITFVWVMNILANIVRGTGNMIIPASAIVIGEVFHLVLAPALILGWGPFPVLGVYGAAIAILLSYLVGACVLFLYLISSRSLVRLYLKNLTPSWPHMKEILGIGGFASLNVLQNQLIVIVTTTLVAGYGQATLAGFGAASRLELLQIPITFALGSSIITMVATNLGANNWERVRQIAWAGMVIATAIGASLGAIALFAGEYWMELFTNDPRVISAGASYLNIIAYPLPFIGAALGLTFALFGANKPFIPFLAINARLLIIAIIGWSLVRLWDVEINILVYVLVAGMLAVTAILLVAGRKIFGTRPAR